MSKDLTEALRALMEQSSEPTPDPMKARGGTGSAKSAAILESGKKGGGIASPLTENSFALRQYHTTNFKTTDGLFSFPAIKKIKMLDANGETVDLIFADPTT